MTDEKKDLNFCMDCEVSLIEREIFGFVIERSGVEFKDGMRCVDCAKAYKGKKRK